MCLVTFTYGRCGIIGIASSGSGGSCGGRTAAGAGATTGEKGCSRPGVGVRRGSRSGGVGERRCRLPPVALPRHPTRVLPSTCKCQICDFAACGHSRQSPRLWLTPTSYICEAGIRERHTTRLRIPPGGLAEVCLVLGAEPMAALTCHNNAPLLLHPVLPAVVHGTGPAAEVPARPAEGQQLEPSHAYGYESMDWRVPAERAGWPLLRSPALKAGVHLWDDWHQGGLQDSTTAVHGAVLLMVQHLRHLCCGALLHASDICMPCHYFVHDDQLICMQHLCLMSQQVCQSQDQGTTVMADLYVGVAELLQAKIEYLHSAGHEGLP